jgi:hypothetical protein
MKLIASIILFLSLFSCVFAQEARKVNEFGTPTCEDFLLRKDYFVIELANNPSSIGYILVYEGKVAETDYSGKEPRTYYVLPHYGEANAYIKLMKLGFKHSQFPLERLVFVKAGFREKLGFEFWLVPRNTTPPKPTPTLKKIKYRKGKANRVCEVC